MVTNAPRQGFRWLLDGALVLGQDFRTRIPRVGRIDASLGSDEQRTKGSRLLSMKQVRGRAHLLTTGNRQLYCWKIPTGGNIEMHAGRGGVAFHMNPGGFSLDSDPLGLTGATGLPELSKIQATEEEVPGMTTHVPETTTAEVTPASPDEGKVAGVIRPLGGWPKPEIPIKIFGNLRGVLWSGHGSASIAYPEIRVLDRSYCPSGTPLSSPPHTLRGRTLITHLSHHLVLGSCQAHHASFMHGSC